MLAFVFIAMLATTDAPTGLVRVSYPLDAVLAPREPSHVTLASIPMTGRLTNSGVDAPPTADSRRVEPDELVDLVRRSVAPDEWQSPGRSIDAFEDGSARLVVTAPEPIQRQVRDLLAFLAAHFRRPIDVRCEAYDVKGNDDALAAIATEADPKNTIAQLVAKGVLGRRIAKSLHLFAGVPQTFARIHERSYLSGYGVEIADAAAIRDPMIDSYAIGFALGVRADVTQNGEAMLQFAARNTVETKPLRRIDAGALTELAIESRLTAERNEGGIIEAPTIAFQTLAGASRIAAGATRVAFVAPLGANVGDDRGLLLAFTIESIGAAEPSFHAGDRELTVRDFASSLPSGGEMPGLPLHSTALAIILRNFSDDGTYWNAVRLDAAAQPDLAQASIGAAIESATSTLSDSAGMSIDTHRGFLFVTGSPQTTLEVADRVVAGLGDGPSAGEFVAVAEPNGGKGSGRRALFCVPSAKGLAIAFNGVEQACLVDADVEVANHASICAPLMSVQMTGRFFHLKVGSDLDGGDSLELTGIASNAPAALDHIEHGTQSNPNFDRLDSDTARWQTLLRLRSGANAPHAKVDLALPGADGADISAGFDLDVARIAR